MNGAKSYVLRALLGATLATAGMIGRVALAGAAPTPTPAPSPTPTPTPTPRYELSVDSGKVTEVGVAVAAGVAGNAVVKTTGAFAFDGPLDLASSSVTIRSLLQETGGAGELFKGSGGATILPLVLFRKSGDADSAVYTSPSSLRPSFRLSLRRKPGGLYLANLKVSRASVPNDPTLCSGSPSTTTLDAVLVLNDAHDQPVTAAGSVDWVCALDKDKLRIAAEDGPLPTPLPTSSPVPTPAGAPPKANVRIDLLTRETGQPSLVLIDGSDSSDEDGSIVSYTFSVTQTPSNALAFGPVTGTSSFVTTTLPPGNYVARLVVKDDQGKSSAQGTRSFSIK